MKISVLMSVYAKEKPKYLVSALNSIKNQSIKPNEFIIVKDGLLSSKLDEVLNQFKNDCKEFNIIFIQLKKNLGLGLALQEGLKHCNYEWIMRMDSDDISRPDRIEIMKKEIINDNFNHDIYGSHLEEFMDFSDKKQSRIVKLTHNEILLDLRKKNPMNHVTIFGNKKSIIDSGGYKDFKSFEDYYLWARMMKNNYKFKNINKVTVDVRIGELMFEKRRGWFYFKQEFYMQKYLYKSNLTSSYDFFVNSILRCSVRLLPIFIIEKIYNIYRKNN
jgi:glycosyltransferase involved in cell wall biosynthesis